MRRARQQPAAAARDEEEIEGAGLFDQLARRGARAGDDVRMVVGRDDAQPAFRGDAPPDCFAVVAFAIVGDDRRAVGFRGGPLDRGRVGRHHDDGWDIQELARERDRLRVVAGRKREDAAAPLVSGEARQRVVGAAELEGAGALQVFALEEHAGAGSLVDAARGDDRRPVRDPGDLSGGALDVGESGQVSPGGTHRCRSATHRVG